MKHSSEPLEPDDIDGGLDELLRDEIARGEEAILSALGRPGGDQKPLDHGHEISADGDVPAAARPPFRDRLREQFLAASAQVEAGAAASVEGSGRSVADAKLAAWTPETPRPEFRDRLRGAFLNAAASGRESEVPDGQHRSPSRPSSIERRSPRPVQSRSGSPRTPLPARASRFRWAAVAGVLVAAAAILLYFRGLDNGQAPQPGQAPEIPVADSSGAGASDAALNPDPERGVPSWGLDVAFGDITELLAAVRIDGEPVATPEEFRSRMETAKRVETLGQEIRILHGDEFVMELAADSSVRFDDWLARPVDGEPQVLRVDRGGLRIATGPGFDRGSPLVVETVQVRAEVLGTVFGVDVWEDHTCVCCFEGIVRTTPHNALLPCLPIGPQRTRVVAGGASPHDRLPHDAPLVEGHRAALERLSGYWT